VPARRTSPSRRLTKIARLRVERGLTQKELAARIGISTASMARLERHAIKNPPLGWLVNAAIVLDVQLDDVLEDWMVGWHGL
jgi:transcriptional regulator with XRE-family HTH domain